MFCVVSMCMLEARKVHVLCSFLRELVGTLEFLDVIWIYGIQGVLRGFLEIQVFWYFTDVNKFSVLF